MAKGLGNLLGAFADGVILFPLLAALAAGSSFNPVTLFASVGLAYLFAGWYFRVPMPIQPLKAVAIAAVATGASQGEVRSAGALVGVVCLLFMALRVERLADRVPGYLVHGVQAGLGLLLMRRGMDGLLNTSLGTDGWALLGVLVLCLLTGVFGHYLGLPALGLLAAAGTVSGITVGAVQGPLPSPPPVSSVRWEFVLALALPQVVLTSANSVLATRDVAHRYFGAKAQRVTITRLLGSIGVGNLVAALTGGLPYCHGAGGLTAHVRGGSRDWTSNLWIGGFCLLLALTQWFWGATTLNFPPLLLGALLALVGYHHVKLAAPSWTVPSLRPPLALMGIVAFLTQNLLWTLACGMVAAAAVELRMKGAPRDSVS